MNPERWQELDNLFHSALQRVAGERAAFLDEACGGDDSLRKQVEALLAAHEAAASFIESPAFEAEARQLAIDEAEENTRPIVGQTFWAQNIRPEAARLRNATDPYPLARFRVNGPLSNMPAFEQAYQCKEGDPMMRPREKRCQIW